MIKKISLIIFVFGLVYANNSVYLYGKFHIITNLWSMVALTGLAGIVFTLAERR